MTFESLNSCLKKTIESCRHYNLQILHSQMSVSKARRTKTSVIKETNNQAYLKGTTSSFLNSL